jgi:hypothetical protein
MAIPTRQFDVFASVVVVNPGEAIQWICEANVPSASVQSGSWALPQPQYSGITPANPVPATVSSSAQLGASAPFNSTPSGPNPTQLFVVAGWSGGVCSDVSVLPGQWILWWNDTATKWGITPQSANSWPLPSKNIIVPAYTAVAIQSLSNAAPNDYQTVITPSCPVNTNPIIRIRSSVDTYKPR